MLNKAINLTTWLFMYVTSTHCASQSKLSYYPHWHNPWTLHVLLFDFLALLFQDRFKYCQLRGSRQSHANVITHSDLLQHEKPTIILYFNKNVNDHFRCLFFLCWEQQLDYVKFFYLPTDAQKSCFKRILKFTLKQLLHVSVGWLVGWLVWWCGCSHTTEPTTTMHFNWLF